MKSADRAKLVGYMKNWLDAKYLLGCAVFVDLLTPCAIFSKTMQFDSLDILGALTSLLHTVKSTNILSTGSLQQWPTYSATLKKVTEENGKFSFQCQVLKSFSEAKCYFENHYQDYCDKVTNCIKSRLSWSDLTTIQDIIFILATNGWQKTIEEAKSPMEIYLEEPTQSERCTEVHENSMECIDRLVAKFQIPLEAANADTNEILAEFKVMVTYASQFISLSTLDYKSVWWRLFNAPNSSEWSNALILVKLLFSLPVSNGTVERTFSSLHNIKTDKRSSMSNEVLKDLLTININKHPLKEFSPESAIKLWWDAKLRRPNQHKRKKYKKRTSTRLTTTDDATTSHSSDTITLTDDDDDYGDEDGKDADETTSDDFQDTDSMILDDWDNWIYPN